MTIWTKEGELPRTRSDFDQWFREMGGDPWGYETSFTQTRLDRSLAFIETRIPSSFDGLFVEIGAFNGDFTARLAVTYPKARIIANDISDVALAQARAKAGHFSNVAFDLSDMAQFVLPAAYRASRSVLIIMEAFYYLKRRERAAALAHLIDQISPSALFVSGPIQGEKYFDERVLCNIVKRLGFACICLDVLNHTDEYRSAVGRSTLAQEIEMDARALNDATFRRAVANQVIYCFEPKSSISKAKHPAENRAQVRDNVAGALSVVVGLDAPSDANKRPRAAILTMKPGTTKKEAMALAQLINDRLAMAATIQY